MDQRRIGDLELMTFRNPERARMLEEGILDFEREERALPGLKGEHVLHCLIRQIEDSIRRVQYIGVIQERDISVRRLEGSDDLFDPLRAAVLHQRDGRYDEAFWCAFLSVHFGKHSRGRWELVRNVYDRLGEDGQWDWATTSEDPKAFRQWLDENEEKIKAESSPAGFGNHRKYQSLSARSSTGTGAAFESYVNWIAPPRSHRELIDEALRETNGDPRRTFDLLFHSMEEVASFGRLARFDYLTLVGNRKLSLAPIEPGIPYLRGATGALAGARLLFGGDTDARMGADELNWLVADLGNQLGLGMQVMEDALCNWQKSPGKFRHFGG